MDDAEGVRRAEGIRHLAGDTDGVLDRERALAREPVAQRFAGHEGHHVMPRRRVSQ
jgi:hypothetical protein